MRAITYLASVGHFGFSQFLPNGMPIPAHLMKNSALDEPEIPQKPVLEIPEEPVNLELDLIEDYGAHNYQPYEKTYRTYDYPTQQTLSFEDFEFDGENNISDAEDLEEKPDSNGLQLDLTVRHGENTTVIHPKRGTFDLEVALKQSRANGYGNGVRLRFAGTSLSQVDPIYLCSKRSNDQCCDDKDPDCFTPGGCFCDSSCRAFDDCCPDFEEHCADKSCLENLKSDVVTKYLRNFRRRPENSDLPSIASGGQPKHVEPNACCNGRPYNHGLRCCCGGTVTDECPCQSGA